MSRPIHIHPLNPKLFEYHDRPLVLITASEHYGAVINRPFNIERYLHEAAEKRMTLSRLFLLFREMQSAQSQLYVQARLIGLRYTFRPQRPRPRHGWRIEIRP